MTEIADQPAEEIRRLQSGLLILPDVMDLDGARDFTISDGSFYPSAVRTHAIPIVDFLVQLERAGVERQIPTFAHFTTARGGEDRLYANVMMNDLSNGIVDVAQAAGLHVAITGRSSSPQWQLPEQFAGIFDDLEFPPALRSRIDPRREIVHRELAGAIDRRPLGQRRRRLPRIADVFPALSRTSTKEHQLVSVPAFQLEIMTRDSGGVVMPGQLPNLSHTISLATPQPQK